MSHHERHYRKNIHLDGTISDAPLSAEADSEARFDVSRLSHHGQPHGERRHLSPHIDHHAHARPGITPFPERLCVITTIHNGQLFRKRYDLYDGFQKHMADSGVQLLTVEVAHGNRPFEVTEAGNPWHVQLRTDTMIWHKERSQNIGLAYLNRIAPNYRYVAFIDADVTFVNPRWAQDVLQALNQYKVVQCFSEARDLTDDFTMVPDGSQYVRGFVAAWHETFRWGKKRTCASKTADGASGCASGTYYGPNDGTLGASDGDVYREGHPGYAWAFRREALRDLGGLYDLNPLGSNDHHMAVALIGDVRYSFKGACHEGFKETLYAWADRAERHVKPYVGYVNGLLHHHAHGPKMHRRYVERWNVLTDSEYNPLTDVKCDEHGLFQFTGNKRKLIVDCMSYFGQRNEDDPVRY